MNTPLLEGDVICLDELFPLQSGLDQEIAKIHNVTYESTFPRRLLALLVELGEFANETRCFKYWSYKPSSSKEVILDEYVDGLHFLLSLGIPLGVISYSHRISVREKDLSTALIKVYQKASALLDEYDLEHYLSLFGDYLNILPLLGYGEEDVIKAYKAKMEINHKRQENSY